MKSSFMCMLNFYLSVSHAHTHTDMPHTKYLEAAGAALVFRVAPQTLQQVQQSWVLTWKPLLRMIPLCVDCPASSPAPVSVHSAHPQLQTNSKMCWDQYQVSLSMLEKNSVTFHGLKQGMCWMTSDDACSSVFEHQ